MANENYNPYGSFDEQYNRAPESPYNDIGKDVGKAALGGFLSGGPGGMVAVGLMQLAGSILTSMFQEEPRLQLTPEQKAFERMTKFYSRMGERQGAMRSIVAGYRGVKPSEVTDIGWKNNREMMAAIPYREDENG